MSTLMEYRDREEDERRIRQLQEVLNHPHLVMDKTVRLVTTVPGVLDERDRLALEQIGASSSFNAYSGETTIQMPRSRKMDFVVGWNFLVLGALCAMCWSAVQVFLVWRRQ